MGSVSGKKATKPKREIKFSMAYCLLNHPFITVVFAAPWQHIGVKKTRFFEN